MLNCNKPATNRSVAGFFPPVFKRNTILHSFSMAFIFKSYWTGSVKKKSEIIYAFYTVFSMHKNIIVNPAVSTQRKQPVRVYFFLPHVYFITYCTSIYRIMFHSTSFPVSVPTGNCFFCSHSPINLISQLLFFFFFDEA